jgi:isoamylase
MLDFTAHVIALRSRHPLFRRRTFFRGREHRNGGRADILWLNSDGGEMSEAEWRESSARCLGAQLSGRGLAERDDHGEPVTDDDLLLLLNANDTVVPFRLSDGAASHDWTVVIDTVHAEGAPPASTFQPGTEYPLPARSLVLLTRARPI